MLLFPLLPVTCHSVGLCITCLRCLRLLAGIAGTALYHVTPCAAHCGGLSSAAGSFTTLVLTPMECFVLYPSNTATALVLTVYVPVHTPARLLHVARVIDACSWCERWSRCAQPSTKMTVLSHACVRNSCVMFSCCSWPAVLAAQHAWQAAYVIQTSTACICLACL